MSALVTHPAAARSWLVLSALALALILGGGGTPAPLPEIVLQIAFAAVFCAWYWLLPSPLNQLTPGGVRLICMLMVGLVLFQLIPLPPAIWQALPGRDVEREALNLIGAEQTWRPIAISPARTLAALLAIGPALAMLVMTSTLNLPDRLRMIALVAAFGLLTVLVGAAQLSTGIDGPLRFYEAESNYLQGFQANHNSAADVLLVAMIAIAVLVSCLAARRQMPDRAGYVLGAAGGALAVLALGVVLTASRFGIVLMIVPITASLLTLRPWLGSSLGRGSLGAIAAVALGLAGWTLLAHNSAIQRVTQRFTFAEEFRQKIWRDSFFTARRNLPFGVGLGNFIPAYQANERLESVGPTIANRAHNELLEVAISGGVPGLAVLALCIGIVSAAAWRALSRPAGGYPGLVLFAISSLILLGLHSLVDYPFRSMSLACLGAACAGMLFPPRAVQSGLPDPEEVAKIS